MNFKNMSKEEFKSLVHKIQSRVKKETGKEYGLWGVATEIVNTYFSTIYKPTMSDLYHDEFFFKKIKLVQLELAYWLVRNYHNLIDPLSDEEIKGFKFKTTTKKAEKYLLK